MRKHILILSVILVCVITSVSFLFQGQFFKQNSTKAFQDWKTIENVFGLKGSVSDNVFKITFPRYDLDVMVSKVTVDPRLALTSWIAFEGIDNEAIMMGDLVLLENETNRVISFLIQNNIDVTALHNHLMRETPRIMYLHFHGHGDPVKLASIMKNALSLTNTPLTSPPSNLPSNSKDWAIIESIMGRTGQKTGNILQFSIPRADKITENSIIIPPAMGVATGIGFQAIETGVATTGDFVLLASEVNPVVQALAANGIRVTAIHNHMLYESPRLFFLHFWGLGSADKLANGLKAALDQTNSVKAK